MPPRSSSVPGCQPPLAVASHWTWRIVVNTLSDMKDALLTLRIPTELRRRIAAVAERDDRSLSQAAERLIELGLAVQGGTSAESGAGTIGEARHPSPRSSPAPLAGLFAGGLVPELTDFRNVRSELSSSLLGRTQLGRTAAPPSKERVRVDAKRRR